jgi:putative PIN family toxin of toxin-antitoxin system
VLVIDTNIWVSYLLNATSPVGRKLDKILDRERYAFSDATFSELADVLLRPKFENYVSRETRLELIRKAGLGASWFTPGETVADCRDPRDNKFLELAVAAGASHILTGDEDLLCLNPFRGIAIQTIGAFDESLLRRT